MSFLKPSIPPVPATPPPATTANSAETLSRPVRNFDLPGVYSRPNTIQNGQRVKSGGAA